MTAAQDQGQLLTELTAKLDHLPGQDHLIAYMGEVLGTLLRRKGDHDFRVAVQDAFINGLGHRDWTAQVALAREVIGVVIAKRPEIAAAWQARQGQDGEGPRRRAADQGDELPDLDLVADPVPAAEPADAVPPYAFAAAEAQVAEHIASVLGKRLALFRLPGSAFPSIAYVHEQNFFLFSPIFQRVAAEFIADTILPHLRDMLERQVYRHLSQAETSRPDMALPERQDKVWAIVIEALTGLGNRASAARLRMDQPAAVADGPHFLEVEVPVERPRVIHVLGVSFRMGTTTVMKRVRTKIGSDHDPSADEKTALDLLAAFRDRAAGAGLSLPAAADFGFLAALFQADGRRLGQTIKEMVALAEQAETSRAYLLERLRALGDVFAPPLADAIALLLFYGVPGCPVGFAELVELCAEAGQDAEEIAQVHPFISADLGRRPRDLAFQLREALRQRLTEAQIGAAVDFLSESWTTLPTSRYASEREGALTVLRAFAMAFSGDPAAADLAGIGMRLAEHLAGAEVNPGAARKLVLELYRPVVSHPAP